MTSAFADWGAALPASHGTAPLVILRSAALSTADVVNPARDEGSSLRPLEPAAARWPGGPEQPKPRPVPR